MLENGFGALAGLFGFLTFVVGLTMQAVKHYNEKEFGIHPTFFVFGTLACVFRLAYSIVIGAWYIVVPDIYGVFISMVICWQYGAYKKNWWSWSGRDKADEHETVEFIG